MASERSVLIVDRSPENREVLSTALNRREVRTLVAARLQSGVELARSHEPDLIVLDMESDDPRTADASTTSFDRDRQHPVPIVLLGTVRCDAMVGPNREFVAKPYHYGPLIRRIEELLSAAGQKDAPAV